MSEIVIRVCLSVFLSLAFPAFLKAQQPADAIQQLLDDLNGFRASFTQTVVEEDGYLLDEQEGILSFEKPNRIFWQVTTPYRTTLVADGDNIYFHDEDLNQVRIRPWSSSPAENPAVVFVGEGMIKEYYHVDKKSPEGEGGDTYILTPREQEDAGYQSLELVFDSGKPVQMTLRDSLGQVTNIQFGPLDQDIPEQPYQFAIPADAEVIVDD